METELGIVVDSEGEISHSGHHLLSLTISAEAAASLFPPDGLMEVELALRCHDGQLVLQVVADEVADAVEQHVFGPDLRVQTHQPLGTLTLAQVCRTYHALWVHQQEVLGQAAVHPSQHVLARVGGALPDQEVPVSDQESLGVPPAHAAVVPRLPAELLLVGRHRGPAARRTGPLVLQDLAACACGCSRGRGAGGSGTGLVELQGVFKRP